MTQKKFLLDLSGNCQKFLSSLPPKQYKQVAKAILEIVHNPYPNDSEHVTGYKPFRRKDVGEYRIIYLIDDNVVRVPIVGKRNDDDIYKKLRRK